MESPCQKINSGGGGGGGKSGEWPKGPHPTPCLETFCEKNTGKNVFWSRDAFSSPLFPNLPVQAVPQPPPPPPSPLFPFPKFLDLPVNFPSPLSRLLLGMSVSWEGRLRPIGRGVHMVHMYPPGAKTYTWWDCKTFKMLWNNVVMVGLIISLDYQQFEDLKFQFFLEHHAPGPPKSPVSSTLAWPVIPTLIIWSQLLSYTPPHKNSWLWAWGWFFYPGLRGIQFSEEERLPHKKRHIFLVSHFNIFVVSQMPIPF